MNWLEAILIGILQGLTEFLPISSSGHIALVGAFLDIQSPSEYFLFTLVVHGATVLSTIVIFWPDLVSLFCGMIKRDRTRCAYIGKLLVSMLPVGVVGFLFKEEVTSLYADNLVFVGCMLIVTAIFLFIAHRSKEQQGEVTYKRAFLMGLAQAAAVLPGISRSGATIATGLVSKGGRHNVARFSFLMVLLPIMGANLLDIIDLDESAMSSISITTLVLGFVAAFLSGLFACKWMIKLVQQGKLIYFSIYCLIVGGFIIMINVQ